MECVRGERPGVFNNRLYHRLLSVLLRSEGAAPEVLGLLIAKFLSGLGGWVGWGPEGGGEGDMQGGYG